MILPVTHFPALVCNMVVRLEKQSKFMALNVYIVKTTNFLIGCHLVYGYCLAWCKYFSGGCKKNKNFFLSPGILKTPEVI